MAETSEIVKLSLRLLIDEVKNKVVLAESGRDFVDVLFSFLTLPMGTIVRLLEKHRKSPQVVVGCLNNLYKSVSEMDLESFQTEACKQILLYPRSVDHDKYRKLKLEIDNTEPVKYFVCPRFEFGEPCKRFYNILNTDECGCRDIVKSKIIKGLMNLEIMGLDEEEVKDDDDGVFVGCETSSFIITDDLKVVTSSMDYVLDTLKRLGYRNAYKLREMRLDVGFSEVLFLLECILTSDSPLTDTFLRKQSSLHMTRNSIPLSPAVQRSGDGAGADQTITFKAFSRKMGSKLLCVECGADFIDLLFTFLALPLESVLDIVGDNIRLGCVGNLLRSLSLESLNKGSKDSSSSKCLLPSYYSCPKQLLDVVTEQREIYYSFKRGCEGETYDSKFSRKIPDCLVPPRKSIVGNVKFMQVRVGEGATVLDLKSFGFVKKNTSFLVTDDLIITPVSNISLLKLKIHLEGDAIEEQLITMGKPEAINLLRASVMTSSALTCCFWNFFVKKKVKEEK